MNKLEILRGAAATRLKELQSPGAHSFPFCPFGMLKENVLKEIRGFKEVLGRKSTWDQEKRARVNEPGLNCFRKSTTCLKGQLIHQFNLPKN